MQETIGYYKQMNTNVIFTDNDIKIGTKTIKYKDIYFIREDYITNHANIFPTALPVAFALIGVLVSFLFLKRFSFIVFAAFAAIGVFLAFYTMKILVVKNNPKAYIKIIDILFTDTHESIVVPADFKVDFQAINEKNKGMWKRRVLKNYISKLNKTRKYLVQQYENNENISMQDLYTKYSTVGKAKNGIKSFINPKTLDVLLNSYTQVAGQYVRYGFMAARFSVVIAITLVVYAVMNKELVFNNFY